MSVAENDRVTLVETTAGQPYVETDFRVDFKEHLTVERRRAGVNEILDLDIDYTMSMLGNDAGCRVIFTPDPAEADDIYALVGRRPVGRPSSFVSQGGVSSASLDAELDTFTRALQEIRRDTDRAFKTGVLDPEGDFDFAGRRITNVGPPLDPDDAVTLGTIHEALDGAAAAATATAIAAANTATAAAGNAQGAAGTASGAAGAASSSAGAASLAQGAAEAAAVAAVAAVAQFPADLTGQAGKHLAVNAEGTGYTLTSPGGGGVQGPASSVSGNIVTFDGETGQLIQDGGITIAALMAVLNRLTAPVTLTDDASVALDASAGCVFTLAATGDRTIEAPTNPTDGQKIVIRHLAVGAGRTPALAGGAGGFRFGSDITALTQTASGTQDYIGCVYDDTAGMWDVVAYAKGY